jgi:hypothetical protein
VRRRRSAVATADDDTGGEHHPTPTLSSRLSRLERAIIHLCEAAIFVPQIKGAT